MDGVSAMRRAQLAGGTIWAVDAYRAVEELVVRERPQVAHFQNTFPLISPSVYRACRRHGVAVVQALRNYRLTCVNGLLFRQGHTCDDAGQSGGGSNALRIAPFSIRPARVHEHRLSRRRDEKRGLPALDIDAIHFERPGSAHRAAKKNQEQSGKGCSHNSR